MLETPTVLQYSVIINRLNVIERSPNVFDDQNTQFPSAPKLLWTRRIRNFPSLSFISVPCCGFLEATPYLILQPSICTSLLEYARQARSDHESTRVQTITQDASFVVPRESRPIRGAKYCLEFRWHSIASNCHPALPATVVTIDSSSSNRHLVCMYLPRRRRFLQDFEHVPCNPYLLQIHSGSLSCASLQSAVSRVMPRLNCISESCISNT